MSEVISMCSLSEDGSCCDEGGEVYADVFTNSDEDH